MTTSSRADSARRRAGESGQLSVCTAITGLFDIVAVSTGPSSATVRVSGELDLTTAALLADTLTEQVGPRRIDVDVSRLTFVDCAGLRTLVVGHNELLHHGGQLVLTGVGDRIRRLLKLTHLDEALMISEDRDEPRSQRSERLGSRRLSVVTA